MSGFCITSLIQDDANFVLSLLQKAGLAPSQPSQRDESMTIERWHEQVLTLPIEFYVDSFSSAVEAGEGKSLQPAGWDANRDMGRDIGRLWEQLASDVFIANMNTRIWGWADSRSADLLPFWAGFDPQLKFVLVTCSPERYLANFIETSDKPFEPNVLLARWQAYHQALLQFSRLHPKRCVITGFEDVLLSPQGLVDTCNETFFTQLGRVGLSALRGFPVGQMAALVATKFATSSKGQEALARELKVSLTPLKVTMHAPRLTNGSDARGQQNTDGSRATQDAPSEDDFTTVDFVGDDDLLASNDPVEMIAHYRRILAEVRRDQPASNPLVAGEVTDVLYRDSHGTESSSLLSRDQLQAKLIESEKEGELLLGQLHQVQEELKKSSQKSDLEEKFKDTEEENELLLAQLHQVQEELENYFLKHQEVSGQYESLQARFQKLVARVPGFVEVDRIEIIKHDKNKSLSTEWRVEGLESAGAILPELNFRTFVENDVACIEFKRANDGSSALKRWPAQDDETSAVVAAVGDEVTGPHRARVLQSISSSDWLLVKTINALLIKELDKPELVKLPRGFNAKGLSTAVTELQSHLNVLPLMLHFDEIRLKSYQEEPEHEYLWFGFTNVLFGNKHIPSFEFRFASVNVPSGSFGSNPRLEFHESGSKSAFDGWFKESEDDFGPKLELRFAQPGVMDMDVWAQIKPRDKKLITALISQLPMFIEQLKTSNSRLMRSWDEWQALAETVHRYFLTCSGALLQELGIGGDDWEADDVQGLGESDDPDLVESDGFEEAAVVTPKRLSRTSARSAKTTGTKVASAVGKAGTTGTSGARQTAGRTGSSPARKPARKALSRAR